MKSIVTLSIIGSALLLLAPGTLAQADPKQENPVANGPKMVRLQVEYIDLSHETLTTLMSDEKIRNDNALRARLGELVKAKEAKIVETQILVAPDGQKATSESIEEYIYPTEYEPAELPSEITVSKDGKAETLSARDFAVGPTPTAFETRNLGATLEFEANIAADGRTIDLRFAPEIVQHVRNEVWSEWTGKHGKSDITMPVMYSIRTSTGVVVADGEYRMVSTVSPKGEDGYPDFDRKVMLFVKCDVIIPGR